MVSAVTMRTLFALFAALAVLFAPLSSPAYAAASVSDDHHAQMAADGHCKVKPTPDSKDPAPAKSCCVATCASLAVAPSGADRGLEPKPEPAIFTLATHRLGYLGEIATPPPRRT